LEIILTHENADFDAIAALLAAHKLNPAATPIVPDRINQNVAGFMTLYQKGLPFFRQSDFQFDNISKVIVVDTQRPMKLRGLPAKVTTEFIDHHPLSTELQPHQTFSGDLVGAATTLLVEQIQQQSIALSGLEATLLALGIYEDTGSLTYGTTTPRDHRAAAWLLEQNAVLDTVREFLAHPLNDEQKLLFEELLQSAENRTIEGYIVTVCKAQVDHYVAEISSVAHRLRDTLESAALFVVVQLPEHIQLVCRATVDAIPTGDIARVFGGGGHDRAAAAAIHDKSLDEVVALLWQTVDQYIQPLTRVADLMSYGVQTVQADKQIKEVVQKLRRIGHEGFPVLENGKLAGLLTLRDVDRAIEHGLDNLAVREIMSAGKVTLKPDDSVWMLEQRMVESGWGQIPILDTHDKLIGIVTRTDLIKHWARIHPPAPTPLSILDETQIEKILGKEVAALIQTIARHAQGTNISLYMVGGVVRDLLLERRNLDLDFVVETSAIDFAERLQKQFGGEIKSFRPFGTAKWKLDRKTATALGLPLHMLPDHIDFATARNEFYEHPTALPTVYDSSIKLDLGRRDFTINSLAVQLSPDNARGRILDFYGGMHDLKARLIRVLHSLSYIDDPTRILRAIRFEQRLGFTIEARTAELIESAKPMLGRITGERLRNELTLLLREKEPEKGLRNLQKRGILTAIHPDFSLPDEIEAEFQLARTLAPLWPTESLDMADLYWHLIAILIPQDSLQALCERLLFGHEMAESMLAARQLSEQVNQFTTDSFKPSIITERLKDVPELALLAVWLHLNDAKMRGIVQRYWVTWRHIRPITNGNTLREMGLKPGPCYSIILKRLQDTLLDEEIRTEADEKQLLQKLIDEGICDDHP
jgi:tRNA nucleotidyltransferase (CCA-adding enzyme)